MKFTVDTRNRDFVNSLTDQTSAVIPALTLGDKFPVAFEFGKDGALDESIGALDTVEVALSSCVTPDRGTFRLFAPGGPITGEPITLPATASAKALASAMAASWDGVSLSDLCITGANGFFRVEFHGSLADTEIDPMTGDGTKLSPRSVVSVNQKTAGGGGKNAVQIISLDSVPLAYADDLTFDDGVFSGILNVDTVAANEAMREAKNGRVSRLLSVRVTDDEGHRTTYAKRPVIVDCTGIPVGPFGGGALPQYLTISQGDVRYLRDEDGFLPVEGKRNIGSDDRVWDPEEPPARRTPTMITPDRLRRQIYNQWATVFTQHLDTYFGGTVSRLNQTLPGGNNVTSNAVPVGGVGVYRSEFGGIIEANLKSIRSRAVAYSDTIDDHNAGAPLLDLRPYAKYPLSVFQNEHNRSLVGGMQYFRARNMDVGVLEAAPVVMPEETNFSYCQPFRNPRSPSEIAVIIRQGGVNGDWFLLHSHDDGETWTMNPLVGPGSYVLARPQQTNRGIWLALHKHPTNPDQRILLLEWRWLDGSIRIPGHGTVVSSVFDATEPYDAFDDTNALVVRDPAPDRSTRLWDMLDSDSTGLEIVFSEFEQVASQGDSYDGLNREYRHVRILKSNYSIATDTVVPMDPGWPLEENVGANYYTAGIALIDSYRVVACSWLPTGETIGNHQNEVGESVISEWASSDAGDNWTEEEIETLQDQKIFRPYVPVRWEWNRVNALLNWYRGGAVAYLVGSFEGLTDWNTEIKIKELE